MEKYNPILVKSKLFALKIIDLYKFLKGEMHEYVLSKQIVRSGTSIGANVREAVRGQSRADFYAKLAISLKEADETQYWLELLYESDYLNDSLFTEMYNLNEELIRILVAILRKRNFNS